MTKFVDDSDKDKRARDRYTREEILRRAAKLIDKAKMADDPALLATDTGKLLFSGLLHMAVDTDAMEALAASGDISRVSNDTFQRAFKEPTSSVRDGIAQVNFGKRSGPARLGKSVSIRRQPRGTSATH
jgi:hypothetical protein